MLEVIAVPQNCRKLRMWADAAEKAHAALLWGNKRFMEHQRLPIEPLIPLL